MVCYTVRIKSHRSSEQVSRASYARWASVQHMGVAHGGFDIAVAEQFLNRADVSEVVIVMTAMDQRSSSNSGPSGTTASWPCSTRSWPTGSGCSGP
jgi:hypothetical protein